MAAKEITKAGQARRLRSWMLGLHATHILDVGGRVGYFRVIHELGGTCSADDLAKTLGLDKWRTKVWCQAACAVGILQATDQSRFSFAAFMGELLRDGSADLLSSHVLASLSRDFPSYPKAFATGEMKTFAEHDEDFFLHQGKISSLRAPLIVKAARMIPGLKERLAEGGRVMDVGSGSGSVVLEFAQEFLECQVTGVEPLPYFAESSRERIIEKGIGERIRVHNIPAQNMQFESQFDLVTMVQVFHELPNDQKGAILERCWHALKPGGKLMLVDRCAPEKASDLHDRRFTMSILEQWFEVTWGNIVNTRTEITDMLQAAGFAVEEDSAEVVPTYWTFVAASLPVG